ncbi:hypothetical protein [Nitrosovibrio sp. Nv6]|nr:hypothetical protein [Nitrosovibrio sp. Nv6]
MDGLIIRSGPMESDQRDAYTIAARLREADWEGELYGWLNPAASVR